MIERRLIEVEGLVQGVGFRPFVHKLATRLDLKGSVRNHTSGVSIDVEGEPAAVETFLSELTGAPPPLAVIERVRLERATAAAHSTFRIESSAPTEAGEVRARVAPDIATCDDCVRELFDTGDRRHRYPFLSCSRCGPRLTISLGGPYDRHRTTMGAFAICDACRREYGDPSDRRFHAQTIACAVCGPVLSLCSRDHTRQILTGDAALRAAVTRLADGAIVAVKGLGGFHLACDATNSRAVTRLRERKRREAKPFAFMVRDVREARSLAELSDREISLLTGPQRPIVLSKKRALGATTRVADVVAPGSACWGIMLPYTPLHHLLLADAGGPLVMTSGNASDEPIAYRDDDALRRLADVADAFLLNDRDIATRCDDSVTRVTDAPTVVRRSRGFAPSPVSLAHAAPVPALGVGGHLKNTFCLTKGRAAYVSHHIGDLENPDAYRALEEGIAHYGALFDTRPEIIAHDLHPDYLSTQLAERISADQGVERLSVQHHHAHVLSCIAEHGPTEPAIGVAFDGTGLGIDGAIWGSEFLLVDGLRFDRLAHLSYVPLPGGDATARHPWRAAVAHLWATYEGDLGQAPDGFLDRLDAGQLALVTQALARPSLSPATSSMGRLFDAVAALLGVRLSAQFEAQAAMELETLAVGRFGPGFAVAVAEAPNGWTIDSGSFIRGVVAAIAAGRPVGEIAASFHAALGDATTEVITRIARRTGVRRVALTGGVFQNVVLADNLTRTLSRLGFDVLVHHHVPCNDGGLSLGQAYAAVLRATAARRPCA